jgi:hypothetical protein
MQTYNDLIELARICAKQARATKSAEAATELRRMADEYRLRAAQLNNDKPSKRCRFQSADHGIEFAVSELQLKKTLEI